MSKALVHSDGSRPLTNPNRELFCQLFATHTQYFGCATDAYIEAFDVDTTKPNHRLSASNCASQLLRSGIVLTRINHFLETRLGLNDTEVDKQLAFCISQSADMRTKLAAIKEYNAMKGRVKTKLELSFTDTSDEELNTELRLLEEEIAQAETIKKERTAARIIDVPGMPNLTKEQQEARASQEPIVTEPIEP